MRRGLGSILQTIRDRIPNPIPIHVLVPSDMPILLQTQIHLLGTLDALHIRPQLIHRLDPLLVRVGVEHDAPARLQIRDAVLDQHRPQRDTRVHGTFLPRPPSVAIISVGIRARARTRADAAVAEIADRARVHASLLALQLGDQFHRLDFRRAADGAGGEDAAEGVEAGHALAQNARDLRDEVLDVTELLDGHEAVDSGRERVADPVDVVAGEVDEHDVLGAVLDRVSEFGGESVVLLWRFAAFDGAGDRVGDDPAFFGFHQQFGAGADELEVVAVDVEEVGGRVDGAELAVDVEGVEVRGAREALGWDGLDDVAGRDVSFEGRDVFFEAGAADVGGVFLVCPYRRLGRQWGFGTCEEIHHCVNGRLSLGICLGEVV